MLTVILTGGASRRMGREKALLPACGETMLSRLVGRFGQPPDEVMLSVDRAGRFEDAGALELVDQYPGKGPLNGLLSAFTQTDAERVFLTAVDLPNADITLAKRLYELSQGYDVCLIRRENGTLETLYAVYTRACLPLARKHLESGRLSLWGLVESSRTRYVRESELAKWDLNEILLNVNTPEEYESFRRRVHE